LENSLSSLSSFWSPPLKLEDQFHHLTQAGMTIKLRHAAHKDSLKSATTAFNATAQTFSIHLPKDAYHAQLITHITPSQSNVTAKSHVNSQDNSTKTTSAIAHVTQKETEEFTTKFLDNAAAHKIFLFGTVNIASSAQPTLSSMPKKNNAITAQTDLSETTTLKLAFQDFDQNL
jgi:hypothetical protein